MIAQAMIALGVAMAALLALGLAAVRLARGPEPGDRLAAVRGVFVAAVVAAAAAATASPAPGPALDAVLILALSGLVAAVAGAKLLQHRSLQPPMADLRAPPASEAP